MKKRILLVGNIHGAYRSQLLIKILTDYRSDSGCVISLVSDEFYMPYSTSKKFSAKVLRRIKAYCAKIISIFELIFKIPFCDVVYVLAMNHHWFFKVYLVNMLWHKPVITDLYISIYDTGLDRGWYEIISKIKRRYLRLKAKYHRSLDKLIIEKSTRVLHLAQFELEYIAKLVGARLNKSKVTIVPLSVYPKKLASPKKSNIFRICWWGTWIPLHGLDIILYAMKILSSKNIKNIKLDLFGVPGQAGEAYKKIINELNLINCVTIHTDKFFSNGKLEEYLTTKCDLALGIFGRSKKAQNAIANKVIDAFSMRLPVLTMDKPVLKEFIDTENELFVCRNSPMDIAKNIIRIMNDKAERKRRAKLGYQRYSKTFTPEQFAWKILRVIDEVTAKGEFRLINLKNGAERK